MIRFAFRFFGFLLLAAAFVVLLYDGTKTIAGSEVFYTPLEQVWAHLHGSSLQWVQAAVERHASEWMWRSVLANVLTAPASLVLAILGAVLMLFGRKKKPLIGYAR